MESLNRSNKHRCDRAYEYKLPKQGSIIETDIIVENSGSNQANHLF